MFYFPHVRPKALSNSTAHRRYVESWIYNRPAATDMADKFAGLLLWPWMLCAVLNDLNSHDAGHNCAKIIGIFLSQAVGTVNVLSLQLVLLMLIHYSAATHNQVTKLEVGSRPPFLAPVPQVPGFQLD